MYKFLDFQLDSAHGLTRDGNPVALEPQALQLLEFLVSRREGIVSKEDIIDEIWNGNAITDAALNTRIRSVRKALGDTAATSRFIKTYPKRGVSSSRRSHWSSRWNRRNRSPPDAGQLSRSWLRQRFFPSGYCFLAMVLTPWTPASLRLLSRDLTT